jgi:hypothetical protein
MRNEEEEEREGVEFEKEAVKRPEQRCPCVGSTN